MAGGSPRTKSAIRPEGKAGVTGADACIPLSFATRLLKYGTTSGLVSSNTMLVRPPDEEHPATRPGPASAAVPSPSVLIIVRRSIPRAAEGGPWATVRWALPDRMSPFRHMALPPSGTIVGRPQDAMTGAPRVRSARLLERSIT